MPYITLKQIAMIASAFFLISACGGGGGGGSDQSDNSGGGDDGSESSTSSEITVAADPTEGGNVSGGGTFDTGETISLTATPADFFSFDGWYTGGERIGQSASLEFEVDGDATVTARFSEVENAERVPLPENGSLVGFAVDDAPVDVAFAVTSEVTVDDGQQGLWRTDNAGSDWTKVATQQVNFIEIAADEPETVVAATDDQYLLSFDGGVSWNVNSNDALLPASDASVVTARDGIYLASSDVFTPGLYRSTDQGTSWEQVFTGNNFLDDGRLAAAAISPADSDTLYVGPTFSSDMHKSSDDGASWFSVQSGLPADTLFLFSSGDADFSFGDAVRVDPSDAQRVFVSGSISVNGGANWSQEDNLLSNRVAWLNGHLVTIEDRTVRVSRDNGATWRDVLPLTAPSGIPFETPDRIATSENHLYFYLDGIDPVFRVPLSLIRNEINK